MIWLVGVGMTIVGGVVVCFYCFWLVCSLDCFFLLLLLVRGMTFSMKGIGFLRMAANLHHHHLCANEFLLLIYLERLSAA